MRSSLVVVLSCFAVGAPCALYAAGLQVKAESAKVSFDAVGRPSALRIHGESKSIQLKLEKVGEKVSGSVEFPLESLDSGIALRDRHMKEKYLEVGKFPTARLEVLEWKLPKELKGEAPISAEGKLTLHGVTQTVPVSLKITQNGSEYSVESDFSLKLPAFSVDIPKFAGITVAEDVSVHVSFVATEK